MKHPGKGDHDEHPAVHGGWMASDAWVFAAIAFDQPAWAHTLVEIIAIADYINHTVPREREFTTAIGRLLSAGLIEADAVADQYRPTETGSAIRQRWRRGAYGWMDTIPPQLRQVGAPHNTGWSLPPGTFDAAERHYLAHGNVVRQSLARWPRDS